MKTDLGKIRILSALNIAAWVGLVLIWTFYEKSDAQSVLMKLKWLAYGFYMVTMTYGYNMTVGVIKLTDSTDKDEVANELDAMSKICAILGIVFGGAAWNADSFGPGVFLFCATYLTWYLFLILWIRMENPGTPVRIRPILRKVGNGFVWR